MRSRTRHYVFHAPVTWPLRRRVPPYSQTEKLMVPTDTNRGVCSWPWQLFALRKADRHLFTTSNRCIPVKNTLGWSAVVFCACETMQLFSVMFYVGRTVRKSDFKLFIHETRNKWRAVERRPSSDRESCFWQGRRRECQRTLPTLCVSTAFSWVRNSSIGRNVVERRKMRVTGLEQRQSIPQTYINISAQDRWKDLQTFGLYIYEVGNEPPRF